MTWYAVQHKPAQGDRAVRHLQNQEITCFYPKIEVEKIRNGKRHQGLEPLFPGYLFVNLNQVDPMWSKLRSTRGILRVVSFAGRPAEIQDQVVEKIRDNLAIFRELGGIKPGQTVEIDEGPFRGLRAMFQSYDGDLRAIVMIEFMRKQHAVSVPIASVRR